MRFALVLSLCAVGLLAARPAKRPPKAPACTAGQVRAPDGRCVDPAPPRPAPPQMPVA